MDRNTDEQESSQKKMIVWCGGRPSPFGPTPSPERIPENKISLDDLIFKLSFTLQSSLLGRIFRALFDLRQPGRRPGINDARMNKILAISFELK